MKLLILLAVVTIGLAWWRRKTGSKPLGYVVALCSVLTVLMAFKVMRNQSQLSVNESPSLVDQWPKVYTASTPNSDTGDNTLASAMQTASVEYQESAPQKVLSASSSVILDTLKFLGISEQPQLVEGQRAVGHSFGKAIVTSVPSGGNVLVFQMPPSIVGKHIFMESQIRGLEEALKGTNLRIVGLEDRPELRKFWTKVYHTSKMDAEMIRTYLAAYPDVVAIVSFAGLPSCFPKDLPGLPPMYVFGMPDDVSNETWRVSGIVRQYATP